MSDIFDFNSFYPTAIADVERDASADLGLIHAPLSSYEPNDTLAEARVLTGGRHEITGIGQDWFRIDALSGNLSLRLTPLDGVDLNLELRNASGVAIRTNFVTGPGAESFTHLLSTGGTYYLRVYPAQSSPADFPLHYQLDVTLPVEDPVEPGDSRATAPLLGQGTHSFSGSKLDWHRIETIAGPMTFVMTPKAGTDLNMMLFRVNDLGTEQLLQFNAASGAETISFTAPSDGTYYLRINNPAFGLTPPNGLELSYTLSVDLPDEDPVQPGDTRETAIALTEGSRTVTAGSKLDWYKIETVSGQMSFTMTPTGGRNLNMALYNELGQVVYTNFVDGPGAETIRYIAPTDGTYYLRINDAAYGNTPPNGLKLQYTLVTELPEDLPKGPNDPGESLATAKTITAGRQTITGSGFDWFRFETGPGQIDLAMLATGAAAQNLNLVLYDAAGNPIKSAPSTGASERFSYHAPESGSYYLRVSSDLYPNGTPNGVFMTYTLDLQLPEKTWSVNLPYGEARGTSLAVFDIDNDGQDEIFIGTRKQLDAQGNEIAPAALIVLNADGTLRWSKSFDAITGPDPITGKRYKTTSVTTPAVFSDVNGDGRIDILIGVGADRISEFGSISQPGDKGGVYAIDASGKTLWSFMTRDVYGAGTTPPDGRPEGVHGAPVVFDIDGDGVREVLFSSWDQHLYQLDGRTGALEEDQNLNDSIGASPTIADLNNDGLFEIIMPSDITDNPQAGIPTQGGVLHVMNNQMQQIVKGWTDQIGSSTGVDFRGKFDEQSLWSTAQIVDLDRDGKLEIVLGTGNFFQDDRGSYIKVWNADGTLRHQLETNGRTLASPLIADIDGDGRPEIVAATISGWVHAWRADGTPIFATRQVSYGADSNIDLPITTSPVAVDLNNDGKLEILFSIGAQIVILDSKGQRITSLSDPMMVHHGYSGSPVVRDIDGDGKLEILTGGRNDETGKAMVFRFENPFDVTADDYRTARYQESQSLNNIQDFVERFYETILGRSPEARGLNDWTDRLYTGISSGADVARGFILSAEFTRRGLSDEDFVDTLYAAFFNRAADAGGQAIWMKQLESGASRESVLGGFIRSVEFANLTNNFGIRAQNLSGPVSENAVLSGSAFEQNYLRGGAADQTLYAGATVLESSPDESRVFGQVYRLYQATLGRNPDPGGFLTWTTALSTDDNMTLARVAGAFIGSAEFQKVYGQLDDSQFIQLLYRNVLGREPDAAGFAHWVGLLQGGYARVDALLGFSDSREFIMRSTPQLDDYMRNRAAAWLDVIEGGAGNDTMNGGLGSDTFIFRRGQGGLDVIHGFEAWDNLQLSGFGFRSGADAIAAMRQSGSDVIFAPVAQGQEIRFVNFQLADMNRVRFNVS